MARARVAKGQGGNCRGGERVGGKHVCGQKPGIQRAKNAKPPSPPSPKYFVLRTYIVGEVRSKGFTY